VVVYGEPGAGEHSSGRLFELAAQTHAREIQANRYPGVPHFRPGIDDVRVVAVRSVGDIAAAVSGGEVAYLAYFGHAGVAPGSGETRDTPVVDRTGPGALWIGNGSGRGANLTSRGGASDRPATDLPRRSFTSDAQIRLFGCRAGLGHPPVAQQIANALRATVFAYRSSGGSLFTTDATLGHAQRSLTRGDITAQIGNVRDSTNVWLVPAGNPVAWQEFHAPPPPTRRPRHHAP
jgi:hypothetical protein